MASGLRSVQAIFHEVLSDEQDRENEQELADDVVKEIGMQEQAELEAEAWARWSDWLLEEPGYLEACVRMLKHARQLQLQKIGRQLTPAAEAKFS